MRGRPRQHIGAAGFVAPEQGLILESDPDRARAIARDAVEMDLGSFPSTYVNNWRRLGFSEEDVTGPSERLLDALFAWGGTRAGWWSASTGTSPPVPTMCACRWCRAPMTRTGVSAREARARELANALFPVTRPDAIDVVRGVRSLFSRDAAATAPLDLGYRHG